MNIDFNLIALAQYTKVMVVGGNYADFKVEVIDLSGNQTQCRSYPDFPIAQGSVGTFINGKVLVCGGANGNEWKKECFSYSFKVKR